MKLTPIFPASVKPVRKGVYKTGQWHSQTKLQSWSYWNGKQWGCFESSIKEAYALRRETEFADQHKRWQGILK